MIQMILGRTLTTDETRTDLYREFGSLAPGRCYLGSASGAKRAFVRITLDIQHGRVNWNFEGGGKHLCTASQLIARIRACEKEPLERACLAMHSPR